MRPFILLAALLTSLASSLASAPAAAAPRGPVVIPQDSFTVLCYHEVFDDVRDYPDPFAVDSGALVSQFHWLLGNGYTPVSLTQILEARRGGKALPPKAILLTFDDAYLSFYTRVYPLLQAFQFPAVLGVVGKWIEAPPGSVMLYNTSVEAPPTVFPSWEQLKEMSDSGLVEIASHSYDLHRGIIANPQGNEQPAATTRAYDPVNGYEDDASWRQRVTADLSKNSDLIKRNIGIRPRVMVWPYGSYNDELHNIATKLGMPISLTLIDGVNSPDISLTHVRRTLIQHNPTLAEFAGEVRGPLYPAPKRVVQVQLDDIYNADPIQQEQNLWILLDRIRKLQPSQVYLQATTDTDGDGVTDAAYFPNRHLPLRIDLFNRVSWQLATRSLIEVYAVMPVSSYKLQPAQVADIYEDLSRYSNFDGLVFQDRSPSSMGDEGSIQFTQQLALRAAAFHAPLKTVGTIFIEPPLKSTNETTAQDAERFSTFIAAYDYVAIVPPADKNPADLDTWITGLNSRLGLKPGDARNKRTVFLLQSDANADSNVDSNIVAEQMRTLQLGSALNFGYVNDDFLHNNPPLDQVAPAVSLRIHPR